MQKLRDCAFYAAVIGLWMALWVPVLAQFDFAGFRAANQLAEQMAAQIIADQVRAKGGAK